MTKIQQAFANGKAFIPFITCGDPDLATTAAVVRAAAANGADLIELGIPFSDPTAEGPVIQGANIRALQGGVNTNKIFDLVRELRKDVTVPLVFMTYANVVFSYGDQYDVALISLIAPTSADRVGMIAKEAEGFIYLVSSLGVTGVRSEIKTDLSAIVKVIRENTDIPVAVGFGISTPQQAHDMAEVSDGAIVGSAVVRLLEQYGQEAAPYVGAYVRSMKEAL